MDEHAMITARVDCTCVGKADCPNRPLYITRKVTTFGGKESKGLPGGVT